MSRVLATVMTDVDFTEATTAAGLVVAVIGVCVGVWAARRYGTRRGLLVIDARTVRLYPVALGMPGEPLVEAVMDPPEQFCLQLRLRNKGATDVTSESFGGRPLRIYTGSGVIAGVMAHNLSPSIDNDKSHILVPPRLIPKNCNWQWSVHVAFEEPFVLVTSPIAHVEVRAKIHRSTVGPATLTIGLHPPAFRGGRLSRSRVRYG